MARDKNDPRTIRNQGKRFCKTVMEDPGIIREELKENQETDITPQLATKDEEE